MNVQTSATEAKIGFRSKSQAARLGTFGLLSVLALAAVDSSGQVGECPGAILFANNPATAVTDSLSGERVVAGTTFQAALYYAPDGVVDPAQFAQLGAPTSFVVPGLFSGGLRYGQSNGFYEFQVRVWESAFGSTYEEAIAAPDMFGRRALRAESNIFRGQMSYGGMPPGCANPGNPGSLPEFGLGPMIVAVPEPGMASLLFLAVCVTTLCRLRQRPKWPPNHAAAGNGAVARFVSYRAPRARRVRV